MVDLGRKPTLVKTTSIEGDLIEVDADPVDPLDRVDSRSKRSGIDGIDRRLTDLVVRVDRRWLR